MGFMFDAMQNALPITSTILLPIGFSVNMDSGLHLSLGYVLNALVGMTKIPYISTTLQLYLSLYSTSVLQSLFSGKYQLQEPWAQLIDYYIVLLDVFQYFLIVAEPFLYALFIRYLNTTIIAYKTLMRIIVLSLSAVLYIFSMQQLLLSGSIFVYALIIIVHFLLTLMYTKQTEPITGPILLLMYVWHLYSAPTFIKSSHWSLSILTESSTIYKLLSWTTFIKVIFSYHVWDMLLKCMLLMVLSKRIKGLEIIMRPLLLIMYTVTLINYFEGMQDYKDIKAFLVIVWHVILLVKK